MRSEQKAISRRYFHRVLEQVDPREAREAALAGSNTFRMYRRIVDVHFSDSWPTINGFYQRASLLPLDVTPQNPVNPFVSERLLGRLGAQTGASNAQTGPDVSPDAGRGRHRSHHDLVAGSRKWRKGRLLGTKKLLVAPSQTRSKKLLEGLLALFTSLRDGNRPHRMEGANISTEHSPGSAPPLPNVAEHRFHVSR